MKRLVLAGAGHAHALLLRALIQQPLAGVEVVVVSPEPLAPYSGMLPGWLAGRYRFDQIVVDFPPLAQAAGARWLQGEIHALDPTQQQLHLADGSRLAYDLLSLNIGSTLNPPPAQHAQMLALRPLSLLRRQVEPLLAAWVADKTPQPRPFVLTAIGGGAAGFEALLALLHRLRQLRPDRVVQGELRSRGSLLPGLAPAARRAAHRALQRAGVTLSLGDGSLGNGSETHSAWSDAVDQRSDLVLWATGAEAQAWQRDPARRGALAVDVAGFIRIDAQLRSLSHPQVFAAGDCASWPGTALPKAGVHAVRMAPVLLHNLRAALAGNTNHPAAFNTHHPQRHFLALLATGDGRAIASRGALAAEGAWAWRWKDHIDQRFVRQFRSPDHGHSQAMAAALPTVPPTPIDPP